MSTELDQIGIQGETLGRLSLHHQCNTERQALTPTTSGNFKSPNHLTYTCLAENSHKDSNVQTWHTKGHGCG